jgi:hypothetical protein
LLVLISMENFEGTHTMETLMRHIGEEKKEDRQEATQHVKRLFWKSEGRDNSCA